MEGELELVGVLVDCERDVEGRVGGVGAVEERD